MVQAYSTYRGLFAWLNWPGYISGTIVQPFATVILYAILGRFAGDLSAVQFYSLGITTFSMAFIIISGVTQSYQYDRTYGTIAFLFVSPANRLVNFLSRSLFHIPNGILSFVVGLLAAWLIVGLEYSSVNWGAFVVSTVLIAISITAFGQLLGVISIAVRDWIGVQSLANGVLLILCGAIIPLQVFPGFLQEIGRLLPITNGLVAVRDAFAGDSLSALFGHLVQEAIIALAYYLVAFLGFLWFEIKVKENGTLERDAL